jgi:hypothetical protein
MAMGKPSDPNGTIDQPRDPELWRLTLAAIHDAGAAADAYLESGGWRPRVHQPTIRTFDSGWPNISHPQVFPPETAATDHSALFAQHREPLKPIAFADVEALAALLNYVRTREDLLPRLSPENGTGRDELVDRIVDIEVTNLPLSILGRARAIGASTDDELLRLYLERERAWLQDPLPVEYVIPLALTALDLDEPLVIDAATRIEPLDTATQAARAPESFSIGSVPETVVGAATHAIVLSRHQLPNPGPTRRLFAHDPEPPLSSADLVCEGLRVLTNADIGYAQVLRRPIGWADRWVHDLPPLEKIATLRRYPDKFDNYAWLRTPAQIPRERLDLLPDIVTKLRTVKSNVRLASRRLSIAVLRDTDDRTVDACIGIEALLGEGKDELSHRISLRAATALATRPVDPLNARTIYQATKKVYSHRSAVVHGTSGDRSRTITLGEQSFSAVTIGVFLLRELLTDVLTRPEGWTAETLDSTLLETLGPPPVAGDIADP